MTKTLRCANTSLFRWLNVKGTFYVESKIDN
jgi:hypothetical protein